MLCFLIKAYKHIHQFALQRPSVAQLCEKLVAVLISQRFHGFSNKSILKKLSRVISFFADIPVYNVFAFINNVGFVFFLEPLSYFVSRRTALCYSQPVYAWSCRVRIRYDLYYIAVFQLVIDSYHFAVDFSAYTLAAYIRMYFKCKVKGSCSRRKLYYIPLWREHENLTRKQIYFQGFHEFLRITGFLLPFKSLSEPGKVNFFFVRRYAFLVFPMSRYTVFGDSVHFVGSYLYFKRLPRISYHRCVKRLIHVWFRHSYIVFEPSRYRSPHGMHQSQHSVAVFYRIYDYPDCHEIEYLIKGFVLIFHFLIYTVKMFGPSVYIIMYIYIIEGFFYLFHHYIYSVFSLIFSLAHLLGKIVICFRIKKFKRYILKLHLHGVYTESCSQRRINIKCFSALFYYLVVSHIVDSPQVVQPVRKLYN